MLTAYLTPKPHRTPTYLQTFPHDGIVRLGHAIACPKAPVLVDLRNVYDPAEVRAKGFAYSSVGRP